MRSAARLKRRMLPFEIGADDRVDGRVDDSLEEVLRLEELGRVRAVLRDVAEVAEDDALLAEHRVERERQHDGRPVFSLHVDVDAGRELTLGEAVAELAHAADVVAAPRPREDVAELSPAEILLVVAGDFARARVREEQAPVLVEDDDAVGGALEEVGVALERAHPPLRLEARDGDLLRLIAERLEHACVAERDRHGVRDGAAETELALGERHGLLRAEEDDAHRAPLVEDRHDRERAVRLGLCVVAHELEQRVRRRVADDEHLAALEHLLDLGVLRELDRQVPQRLVVARRDDVADVRVFAHEHDRDAVDARDLGDSLDDREENAAKIEVRRERLRHLEDDVGVALLALELLHRRAEAELPADARDELDRAERLAHEVVGARLESARDLAVGVERRQHHDRDVASLGPGAQNPQDLIPVRRRHHEIEQDERRPDLIDLGEGLRSRAHRDVRQVGGHQRLAEHVAADRVVVHHEHETLGHDVNDTP